MTLIDPSDVIEKSLGVAAIGEIRNWNGTDYKKIAPGKWIQVTNNKVVAGSKVEKDIKGWVFFQFPEKDDYLFQQNFVTCFLMRLQVFFGLRRNNEFIAHIPSIFSICSIVITSPLPSLMLCRAWSILFSISGVK